MDKEVYIKEELETVKEEWDIKWETEQHLETQFAASSPINSKEAKEASSSGTEEDENEPQHCWKRDIHQDDDEDNNDVEVNEEFQQIFVCGFPSNVTEKPFGVEELIPKESNPLLIDESLHRTSTNQSFTSKKLPELRRLIFQDTSHACNSLEDKNSVLTKEQTAKMKSLYGQCPVCKEFVNSLRDLKNHSLRHGEVWPYICVKCNKVFNYESGFRSHMFKLHRASRSYTCQVCNMTFKDGSELHNHKFVHTGRKVFSCPICNKAFTTNQGCLLHMKNLHQVVLRPYSCSKCKEAFRLRQEFERHICRGMVMKDQRVASSSGIPVVGHPV
ncbi:zinc finger protein 28 isoform X2 [Anabrus simplex]|uniref:zinc finger protein 28 isoform X2 n=1 Tax=Anabrus simplex TaxID=316456 RepID=UPI0035A32838